MCAPTLTGSGFNGQWGLSKHPGEYVLKVLRKGLMSRVMKFTDGADGKIVDPGFGASLGSGRMLFPVEIKGDGDANRDKNAWKTGAFYGIPAAGFVAPMSAAPAESPAR